MKLNIVFIDKMLIWGYNDIKRYIGVGSKIRIAGLWAITYIKFSNIFINERY